jgi:tRNA(fMet)-specific endonuclease VapC
VSYLLDTDTCILYLNQRDTSVQARLASTPPSEIFLCDVVKAELYFGAYNSSKVAKNLQTLRTFFAAFASLPFDRQAADVYGHIRSDLVKRGELIGPNDMMIAAIALANSLVLVIRNVREFNRVNGLNTEDWTLPSSP